jgi:hypothetical protein
VYYRRRGEDILIDAIFVDDGIVCGSNVPNVKNIIDFLSKEFDMRCLPATRFLGLDIHRDQEQRKILINQPDFIKKIIVKYKMDSCNPTATPADPCTRLTSKMSPTSEEEKLDMTHVPYREAVGCLLYLSITCRPDISYAVNQVAKFCPKPGRAHWSAVKRILSYLSETAEFGIFLGENSNKPLIGYTDTDFGSDIDSRCSTSEFAFFVYGSLVS